MGTLVNKVTDAVGLTDSEAPARAAQQASQTQAAAQREALEYMKEREAVPQQFREGALNRIGGLYGLEGGDPNADQAIRNNPIFQATLGQLPQQEEAILRNQSATGALRSGGTDMMLANNQRMNTLNAYQNTLGGLQGLASLPSNANAIAQQTSSIGQTLGQGQIAAAQANQAAGQQGFGNLIGAGQLGLAAYGAGLFCDPILKDNAIKVGEFDGLNIYHWTWNDKAKELGLKGEGYGPMADEVEALYPDRVEVRNGYKFVKAPV